MLNVALRGIAEGRLDRSSVDIQLRDGLTVADVLGEVSALDPELKRAISDEGSQPRQMFRVLVNGAVAGPEQVLSETDRVMVGSPVPCDG
ncbi:MoaD/ThiS family protein [Arthrobacter sp. 4R501]|uniref:MoaD/ThiS family protein n=1 Tax=Arthrobacter sp. 4R501 TaxID=2058886 RepID=UPI000CE39BC0|nr:MoaD/ThiS family protein [Arthrobacter sp. 4R501]